MWWNSSQTVFSPSIDCCCEIWLLLSIISCQICVAMEMCNYGDGCLYVIPFYPFADFLRTLNYWRVDWWTSPRVRVSWRWTSSGKPSTIESSLVIWTALNLKSRGWPGKETSWKSKFLTHVIINSYPSIAMYFEKNGPTIYLIFNIFELFSNILC